MSTDIALQSDFNGDMFMLGLVFLVSAVLISLDRGWIK